LWFQTAGLAIGGYNTTAASANRRIRWIRMDCWWKFRNSRNSLAGAGTQTAGLAFGGNNW
jgi:hypothetical protein